MRRTTAKIAGVLITAGVGVVITFIVGMRAKYPPVLDAVRRMNRSVFNPAQMESAGTPGAYASVIRHRGRTSGRLYDTPVQALATDDGFVIALPYGSHTDWLRNVLAAGAATIVDEGRTFEVEAPEVTAIESAGVEFPDADRRAHRLFDVDSCLRLMLVAGESAETDETDALKVIDLTARARTNPASPE